MKILNARIEGFRLLSKIEIKFSTDNKRNITVVRAANESGKTTLLIALQWCLYGDEVLPKGYSLRHMDLNSDEHAKTRVEIEYEIEGRAGIERYKIIRRIETTGYNQSSSDVNLYEVKDSGLKPLLSPNNHIKQHLPLELREVFFTDGDRALSFIEGAKSEPQLKVKAAIEGMMGLSLLEKMIEHLKTVERSLRKKIEQKAENKDISILDEEIQKIKQQLFLSEEKLKSTQEKVVSLEEKKEKADQDLQEALSAGNRQDLLDLLKETKNQRQQLEERKKSNEIEHSKLLVSKLLAQHLMAKPLNKAKRILDDLHIKGIIPNQTIPILEDRLDQSKCICGESLDKSAPDGIDRRKHIESLIRKSKEEEELRHKLTDIYYFAQQDLFMKPKSWKDSNSSLFKKRSEDGKFGEKLGEKEAEIEAKLAKIPDINLKRLREMKQTFEDQHKDEIIRKTELVTDVKTLGDKEKNKQKEFEVVAKKIEKIRKINTNLSVVSDIKNIVEKSLDQIKTVEVKSVSELMNNHFLSMIGAGKERSLIQKSEITTDFKIVVYGRNGKRLDPSIDLNGASRRALTISFVLALSKISGVEGPNVIDTPLGMTSGYVRTEIVRTAADNSSQLILFLTHDEIEGCQDIFDERAIVAATMTNPAHYPSILKNDPRNSKAEVLQCYCDHRSVCELCDRYESSNQLN